MMFKQKLAREGMPRVEFHGDGIAGQEAGHHRQSNIDGAYEVTDHVRDLTWTHSVNRPWETINLRLEIPYAIWEYAFPGIPVGVAANGRTYRHPTPGWWVVIRTPQTGTKGKPAHGDGMPATAWGRVKSISTGITTESRGVQNMAQGQVRTIPVRISCESWVSMVAKSRLAFAPGAKGETILPGFIEGLQSWSDELDALLANFLDQPPGAVFSEVWRGLCRIRLPHSLVQPGSTGEEGPDPAPAPSASGEIRDEIPLVHDRQTCTNWAPLRLPQMLRVPGRAIQAGGNIMPRGSLWGWLMGMFGADPRLVEVFPSLEFPSTQKVPSGKTYPQEDGGVSEIAPPEQGHPDATYMTALGEALGAQPVLMYRLRPTLLLPIDQVTGTQIRRKRLSGLPQEERLRKYEVKPFAERLATLTGKTTTYGQEPIHPRDVADTGWQRWRRDEIQSLQISYSDADRINGVHVKLPIQPTSQLELYGLLGDPVISRRDIQQHGLRMADIEWPFLLWTEGAGTGVIAQALTAFIEIAYSMVSNASQYYFGGARLKGRYKPWLRAGYWMEGGMPERLGSTEGLKETGWTAYAETVTHNIRVSRDEIRAYTEVEYSRFSMLNAETIPVPYPLRVSGVASKPFRILNGEVKWGHFDENGEFVIDNEPPDDNPFNPGFEPGPESPVA